MQGSNINAISINSDEITGGLEDGLKTKAFFSRYLLID